MPLRLARMSWTFLSPRSCLVCHIVTECFFFTIFLYSTQGVFEVCEETLVEIGEGVGVDDIRAATGASFQVHNRG